MHHYGILLKWCIAATRYLPLSLQSSLCIRTMSLDTGNPAGITTLISLIKISITFLPEDVIHPVKICQHSKVPYRNNKDFINMK